MEPDPRVDEYLKSVQNPAEHLADLGVEGARSLTRDMERRYAWDPAVEVDARDEFIEVDGGADLIPVRIYSPRTAPSSRAHPTVIWVHGGGWVLGEVSSLDADATCKYLSATVPCLVVSAGYRLAPESKFPVPAEDVYALLEWAGSNVARLGGDRARLAVSGDSAGGNLTAAVCLMSRDRDGPRIAYQAPIYPVMDFNTGTESYRLYGRGYGLDTEDMVWFWEQYLHSDADAVNPYAAPLQADDLAGLPPAYVVTAGLDPLRDEGEAYAKKLKEAGVPVKLRRYEGMPHGFFTLPFGDRARHDLAEELRAALSKELS